MRQIRLSIIGFGTVGRWLAEAIYRRRVISISYANSSAKGKVCLVFDFGKLRLRCLSQIHLPALMG